MFCPDCALLVILSPGMEIPCLSRSWDELSDLTTTFAQYKDLNQS